MPPTTPSPIPETACRAARTRRRHPERRPAPGPSGPRRQYRPGRSEPGRRPGSANGGDTAPHRRPTGLWRRAAPSGSRRRGCSPAPPSRSLRPGRMLPRPGSRRETASERRGWSRPAHAAAARPAHRPRRPRRRPAAPHTRPRQARQHPALARVSAPRRTPPGRRHSAPARPASLRGRDWPCARRPRPAHRPGREAPAGRPPPRRARSAPPARPALPRPRVCRGCGCGRGRAGSGARPHGPVPRCLCRRYSVRRRSQSAHLPCAAPAGRCRIGPFEGLSWRAPETAPIRSASPSLP